MASPIEPTPPLSVAGSLELLAELRASDLRQATPEEQVRVTRAARQALAEMRKETPRLDAEQVESVRQAAAALAPKNTLEVEFEFFDAKTGWWARPVASGIGAYGITPGAALDAALLARAEAEDRS